MVAASEIYQIEAEIVATQLEFEITNGSCLKLYTSVSRSLLFLEKLLKKEEKRLFDKTLAIGFLL
jgi:hypothetical protein